MDGYGWSRNVVTGSYGVQTKRKEEEAGWLGGGGLSAVQSTIIHLLRESFACRMPFSCHAQARNVETSAAMSWDHDRS